MGENGEKKAVLLSKAQMEEQYEFELLQWIQGSTGRKCGGCNKPIPDHVWGNYGYLAAFPRGSHAAGESLKRLVPYGYGCEPVADRKII